MNLGAVAHIDVTVNVVKYGAAEQNIRGEGRD